MDRSSRAAVCDSAGPETPSLTLSVMRKSAWDAATSIIIHGSMDRGIGAAVSAAVPASMVMPWQASLCFKGLMKMTTTHRC